MIKIQVQDRTRQTRIIEGRVGESLMMAIRDSGFGGIQAICGGSCACATCHVYIDQEFSGCLPPLGDDEDMLLDASSHRMEASRLACQVKLTDAHEGLRVEVAPED